MATFSFAIAKKKSNSNKTQAKQYTTLRKGMVGIVSINLEGNFYISINNSAVPILKECYDTKGKSKIFSRKLDQNSKRLCIVRNKKECSHINKEDYLPFAPGCIAEGNILLNPYGKLVFDIKHIKLEYENIEAKSAFLYWKHNYNEIERNRKKDNGI